MKVSAALIYGVVVLCLALMYMAVKGSREGFGSMSLTQANTLYGLSEGFASGGYEFIMMHMPGCGHCVNAMPSVDAMIKESPMTINGKSVAISKIDGVADSAASKKFGVDAFPTFVLVKPDGSFVKYGGERNTAGYKAFLEGNVA